MARVIIRILDNAHPTDAALTLLRTQIGDVISVVDDGHVFSPAELNCGQYRVIDVIGATQEQLTDFVAARVDASGLITRKRDKSIDASVILSPQWAGITSVTLAQINAVKITRA